MPRSHSNLTPKPLVSSSGAEGFDGLIDALLLNKPSSVFDRQAWALEHRTSPDAGWSHVPEEWRASWHDRWVDPLDQNRDGTARNTSLNVHLAVYGGFATWLSAWQEVNPGHNLQHLASDILEVMNAVALHTEGKPSTFDDFMDLWCKLDRLDPEVTQRDWKERHWLTRPLPLGKPPITTRATVLDVAEQTPTTTVSEDPSSTRERWRLRWVDHWLDLSLRHHEPSENVRWEKPWSWVQGWLDDQCPALSSVLSHSYRSVNEASETGSGWRCAILLDDAHVLDTWTRWEREHEGTLARERQWQHALNVLLENGNVEGPQALKGAYGTFLTWGERRLLDGDPSPADRSVFNRENDARPDAALSLRMWQTMTTAAAEAASLPDPHRPNALQQAVERWDRAAETYALRETLVKVLTDERTLPSRERRRL